MAADPADVLTVGPGQQFASVADAVAAAQDGQTIAIDAGTYTNDFTIINKDLTIQANGGPVVEQATEDSPNGKGIWEIGAPGASVTVDGIAFSGATDGDGNGAGIRYDAGILTLTNDYFYRNQDGLLANPDPSGTITIANSEFADNGAGDGTTHNLYVDQVATLDIEDSYFEGANVGHEIKSRAYNTIVHGSRVQDQDSNASYAIDLPNGGNALIADNVIEKGANSENSTIIAYGEEGNSNPGALTVRENTILDDLQGHTPVLVNNYTSNPATITDNQLYGVTPSQLAVGAADVAGNTYLTAEPALDTTPLWPPSGSGAPGSIDVAAGETVTTDPGGANAVYMGSGSEAVLSFGTDMIYAGSGVDTITASSGNAVTVAGGPGNLLFAAFAGTADITLQAGTNSRVWLDAESATIDVAGNSTIGCGASTLGSDIFNFTSGGLANVLIKDFTVGQDFLSLTGFGPEAERDVIQGAVNTSAGELLTLPDGTEVTLAGIQQATTALFT